MLKALKIQNAGNYFSTGVGVALAQGISFFSLPFIAKLSGAEFFGNFNFTIAVLAVLSVLVSLRLEYCVFNLSQDRLALLIKLFGSIVAVTSIIFTILFYLYFTPNSDIFLGLLSIAITLFSLAKFEFLIQLNIKLGHFRDNAYLRVIRAVVFPLVFYGFYQAEAINDYFILLSFAASNLIPIFIIRRKYQYDLSIKGNFNDLLLSTKSVIVFLIPAHLLNRYSANVFLILTGLLAPQSSSLAFYALAAKFTIAPASIFVAAISDVVKREVLVSPKAALNNYFKITTLAGGGVLFGIFLIVKYSGYLIQAFIGNEWEPMSRYMVALTPLLFSLVVFGPITYVYVILGKQKIDFSWQLFNAIFVSASLFIGAQYSHVHSVWYFSIASSFSLFLSFCICVVLIKNQPDGIR